MLTIPIKTDVPNILETNTREPDIGLGSKFQAGRKYTDKKMMKDYTADSVAMSSLRHNLKSQHIVDIRDLPDHPEARCSKQRIKSRMTSSNTHLRTPAPTSRCLVATRTETRTTR